MMYRETVHDTEELLLKEMEKINSKGEISSTDLCNIKYASQALMDLETYEAMKEYGEDASFSMGRRSLPHEESWRRGVPPEKYLSDNRVMAGISLLSLGSWLIILIRWLNKR